jgi:hypothetical protein
VARKRVAKKLKVTETTSQEVSSLSRVVEYLFLDVVYADDEILLLAGDSAFQPCRGDEGDWDTVGEPAGTSRSPAPTVEELVEQLMHQPPVAEGRTEPTVAVAEKPTATEAAEEALAEAGLVDIASILGAPTVTVVWSSL